MLNFHSVPITIFCMAIYSREKISLNVKRLNMPTSLVFRCEFDLNSYYTNIQDVSKLLGHYAELNSMSRLIKTARSRRRRRNI